MCFDFGTEVSGGLYPYRYAKIIVFGQELEK